MSELFGIKARVYDLQVNHDEMHQLKWGLFRTSLYQAEHFKKWKDESDSFDDFIEKTRAISMHRWITKVLEHGAMFDHKRLIRECKEII